MGATPCARLVQALLLAGCLVSLAEAGRFIDFPTTGRTNKVNPPSFHIFITHPHPFVFVFVFVFFSLFRDWLTLPSMLLLVCPLDNHSSLFLRAVMRPRRCSLCSTAAPKTPPTSRLVHHMSPAQPSS
jgi:hypothetical protein